MRKRSELFFNFILIPVDFLAILASFIAAYALRVKISHKPVAYPLGIVFFLKVFLLVVPGIILIFALSGLYNMSSLRGRIQELGKVFIGVSGAIMLLILIDFSSQQPIFPGKAVPIYMYGIALVLVAVGRQIIRSVQRALFRLGIGVHRTVIVGSGPIATQLAERLKDTATSGYAIVGAIDSAKGAQKRMKDIRVDHSLTNLINRLGGVEIDEILQADSSLEPEQVLELVQFAANNHLTYRFVPNQLGIFAAHSTIGTMAGMPIVEVKRTPLEGWGRIVKRSFDLVSSVLGLVVLSPFLLLIALLILVTDPGPVFYRHKRLSRTGTTMHIYKFRSMKAKYCTGAKYSGKNDSEIFAAMGRPDLVAEFARDQKVKDDPRVTKFGNWLRRTSLDELPQLINIARGDISLVGPRPIVQDELERYGLEQSKLLALRPGLTGLWQISGRNEIGYGERVKLDVYYVENWSFILDLRIIMRTIWIVLTGKGAY